MGNPEKAKEKSQADLDLEYVRQHLLLQSLGNPLIEAPEIRQKKEQESDFIHRTSEGYRILSKELFRLAHEGILSVHEEIEPVSLDECLLNAEILNSPDKLKVYLEKGGHVQDLHNFSVPVMLTFYEIAKNLTIERRQSDAAQVFTLLTQLNPRIPSFWIGLGLAFEEALNWIEAHASYQTAIAQDPSQFDSYIAFVRCCAMTKDYALAKEILDPLKEGAWKEQVQEALNFIEEKEAGKGA